MKISTSVIAAGALLAGMVAGITPAVLGNAAGNDAALTPGTAPACTAEAIGADTSIALRPDVVCSAGFAMALRLEPDPAVTTTAGVTTTTIETTECARVDQCAFAEIFHVTTSGWVHDGRHRRDCAENLGIAFISPAAVAAFAPVCNSSTWPAPPTLRRGDRGLEVMYVQIALVSDGYGIAIDGTFGPETESALKALQTASGLPADGVANPQTHAALGTGPNPPVTTTTTTTSTTTTTTTTTTTPATTTTTTPISVVPGTPPACTVETISADTGLPVGSVFDCHSGWAMGLLTTNCLPDPENPEFECEAADFFHLTEGGWVYDGLLYPFCAEVLAESPGMSIYTGLEFAPTCDEGASIPARTNIAPGSTGPQVANLQIALVAVGYPISVDGEYGPRTEAAVRDFQSRNGLEVDGIAGPNTQAQLAI